MLETAATFASWVLIAAGSFFVVVGATGLARMPDVFTRMHAVGILDTVGAGLMLVGLVFAAGLSLVSVKLLIILAVILFTSPVATHALAQAALHAGVEPVLDSKRVLGVRASTAKKRKPPAETESESGSAAASKPAAPEAASTEQETASAKAEEEGDSAEAEATSAEEESASAAEEAGRVRGSRAGRARAARLQRRMRRRGASTRRSGRRRTKPSNS